MAKKPEYTEIVVNRHVINSNKKAIAEGEEDLVFPPIRMQTNSRKPKYGHEVHITGKVIIKYSPHNPRSCGATVWIETEDEYEIVR